MMNMKVDKKVVMGVAGGTLLVLLGTGLYLLCRPMVIDMQVSREEQKKYAAELLVAKDVLAKKSASGVIAQLTPKDNVSAVMKVIKEMAAKCNVKLKLVRPPFVGPVTEGVSGRVLIDMKAVSSLKDLGTFMTSVRNMSEGLVAIETFHVLPDEANAEVVNTKITFILLVAKDDRKK